MKKLSLLLIVVFLSACSTSAPAPTQTLIPTKAVTPAPSIMLKPSATPPQATSPKIQTYLDTIYLILDDISEAGAEMDELFYLASARVEYLENEAWLELINNTLDSILESADEIDAISPVPVEAEKAHEYFKLAAEELRFVVQYQREVIEGNFDSAYAVTEHMQLHFDYVDKAFDEIMKIQP